MTAVVEMAVGMQPRPVGHNNTNVFHLVYCCAKDDVCSNGIYPDFLAGVRNQAQATDLLKASTRDGLPPWDAPAMMFTSGHPKCTQHPYYKEAVRRHADAPFVRAPQRYANRWAFGQMIFWPAVIKSLHARPLLVASGDHEVFWHTAYAAALSKSDTVDMHMSRAAVPLGNRSLTMHYVQGASLVGHPGAHPPARARFHPKTRFCAAVISSVMRRNMYPTEALVRHAMLALLSEYKACPNLSRNYASPAEACNGTFTAVSKCVAPYKFVVAMENSRVPGYISEKLFDALDAGGVPVYVRPRIERRTFTSRSPPSPALN